MDKDLYEKYGDDYKKEYEKTFQYQFEQLEKNIYELVSNPDVWKLVIIWTIGALLIWYFL